MVKLEGGTSPLLPKSGLVLLAVTFIESLLTAS